MRYTMITTAILLLFAAMPCHAASVATTIDYDWLKANATIVTSPAGGRQYYKVDDMLFPVERERKGFGAASNANIKIWPQGVLYYQWGSEYTPDTLTQEQKSIFLEACNEWTLGGTGLSFVNGKDPTGAYMIPINGSYNGAFLGYSEGMGGGILLASWDKYIIAHEIGHVLGLIHEHQRADRDTYVTINEGNIKIGERGQFVISSKPTYYTCFDLLSLMHYSRQAFSSNGQDTITCNVGYEQFQNAIGQAAFISPLDRVGVAKLYGVDVTTCSISVAVNDGSMGSVRVGGSSALRSFDASLLTLAPPGVPLTLTAVPQGNYGVSDYAFDHWEASNATVSDAYAATATFTPIGDCAVKGWFGYKVPHYIVVFTAGEGGAISGESTQIVKEGDSTTAVVAVADEGHIFSGWTGDAAKRANPLVIGNVTRDMAITATFLGHTTIKATVGSRFTLNAKEALVGYDDNGFSTDLKPFIMSEEREIRITRITRKYLPTMECQLKTPAFAGSHTLYLDRRWAHGIPLETMYIVDIVQPTISSCKSDNGTRTLTVEGEFWGETPKFTIDGKSVRGKVVFDADSGASSAVISNSKGLTGTFKVTNKIGAAEIEIK